MKAHRYPYPLTIQKQGRVTIPWVLRQILELKTGDKIILTLELVEEAEEEN